MKSSVRKLAFLSISFASHDVTKPSTAVSASLSFTNVTMCPLLECSQSLNGCANPAPPLLLRTERGREGFFAPCIDILLQPLQLGFDAGDSIAAQQQAEWRRVRPYGRDHCAHGLVGVPRLMPVI